MLAVQSHKYIYPPRPENCIPRHEANTFLEMGWAPQIKYNDTRCLTKILPGHKIELWNRHGEKIRSYNPPEWLVEQIQQVAEQFGLTSDNWHLLDGGLLDNKHQAIKDTIVIWDILVKEGQHLLGTTYQNRYNMLLHAISTEEIYWCNSTHHEPLDIGIKLADNVVLARTYTAADYDNIWETVNTANKPYLAAGRGPVLEGVVLKDLTGVLQMGYKQKNNSDWMVKSRVETGRHRF